MTAAELTARILALTTELTDLKDIVERKEAELHDLKMLLILKDEYE